MKRSTLLLGSLMMIGFATKAQTQAEGVKALDYENFATAKRIFSGLVKSSPSDPLNYYYLGIALCNTLNFDSARIIFNAGTQADPKSIYNYVGLGRTYLEQNNTQQAQQYFDKAKSLTNQKDLTQYITIADAYTNAQHPDYNMAVNLSNKAIEYSNKNADVYWELGSAYEGLKRSGDAVNAYERATELNPSMAKAYTRIGVIWMEARRGELSKENFDKALQADPNYPPAYRDLAELYHATGQDDKATEAFEKYRSLADKDDNLEFRYAQFLFLTKNYQDALNILENLKTKMDVPVLYRLLGYSNYEIGNYPEGLKQIRTFFVKTDPAKILPSDYEYLGKLEMHTGADSVGFLDIQKAISVDSSKYYLEDTIATYLYKQKKYAEAGEYFEKKIALMPKNAPFKDVASSYFQAGKAYYFGHKYADSDSVFQKLSTLSPDWPISYLFIARNMLFIDSLDTARSKAFPYYQMYVSKAYNDSITYKKDLAEAYQYLGNYNAFNRNYGSSLYYFGKALMIDPNNNEVNETVKEIKAQYKATPGSPIAVEKDSSGFQIPVIINGNTVKCLYNPLVVGISVTPDARSQFTGTESNGGGTASIVKVGEHSVKNVPITVDENAKRPISIGADVLNKMNIVLDFASSSLLQR